MCVRVPSLTVRATDFGAKSGLEPQLQHRITPKFTSLARSFVSRRDLHLKHAPPFFLSVGDCVVGRVCHSHK